LVRWQPPPASLPHASSAAAATSSSSNLCHPVPPRALLSHRPISLSSAPPQRTPPHFPSAPTDSARHTTRTLASFRGGPRDGPARGGCRRRSRRRSSSGGGRAWSRCGERRRAAAAADDVGASSPLLRQDRPAALCGVRRHRHQRRDAAPRGRGQELHREHVPRPEPDHPGAACAVRVQYVSSD
jgi:hypothetical protein